MPSERELADQLGVGRPSIREAMRALEVMGYIEIRQGKGMFVAEPTQSEKRVKILQSMLREDAYVVDLLEVREIFEPQIAFLAAQSATDVDIAEMEKIIERMEKHAKAGESSVDDNIDFHLAIAKSVDNQVLYQVQKLLLKSSKDIVTRYFDVPGRKKYSLAGHYEILKAIKERNPEQAKQVMLTHLRSRFAEPDNNNGHRHPKRE